MMKMLIISQFAIFIFNYVLQKSSGSVLLEKGIIKNIAFKFSLNTHSEEVPQRPNPHLAIY